MLVAIEPRGGWRREMYRKRSRPNAEFGVKDLNIQIPQCQIQNSITLGDHKVDFEDPRAILEGSFLIFCKARSSLGRSSD
jgi:hypothetical protein